MRLGEIANEGAQRFGKPLNGVRVLAAEQMQSLPWATQLMARLGADVVKVEHPVHGESGRGALPAMTDPEGRRVGATFLRNNLNKRSVGIDLKKPEGRDLFLRMAPHYDVVAENFLSWVAFGLRNLSLLFFLPVFLFGLWAWRRGIPQDPEAHFGSIRRTYRLALPVGLALNAFAVVENLFREGLRPRVPDLLVFAAGMSRFYGTYVLALGYAAGLTLLARHEHEALNAVRLEAPVAPLVRNILCVGWNYLAHFAEGRGKRDRPADEAEELPQRPAFFTKATGCLIGPFDAIEDHAAITQTLDYEAELAVVIGVGGRDIAEEAAPGHVLGYAVANDVSARNVQRGHGGQWFRGKSLDATCPIGPWLVTPDELGELGPLAIRCRVNGETLQEARLGDMHFGVPRIIAELSAGLTLLGGDVILTGTPPGVGFARTPPRYLRALDRYRYGHGVFKVDWALDRPIPWKAAECGRAAAVDAPPGVDREQHRQRGVQRHQHAHGERRRAKRDGMQRHRDAAADERHVRQHGEGDDQAQRHARQPAAARPPTARAAGRRGPRSRAVRS